MINLQSIETCELEHWFGQIKRELKARNITKNTKFSYIARKNKPKVYHLFVDGDTVCKMYSTGGLNHDKYELINNVDMLSLCRTCMNVENK